MSDVGFDNIPRSNGRLVDKRWVVYEKVLVRGACLDDGQVFIVLEDNDEFLD